MSLGEELQALQAQLQTIPDEHKLAYFQGWIAKEQDPVRKGELTAMWGVFQALGWPKPRVREQVVVLLHGIRTEATWQNKIAGILRSAPGTQVHSIGYGWFDAFRFWLPAFCATRSIPGKKVARELRDVRAEHPQADLVVIAHSFGTYLIAGILAEHTDIRLRKLVLCGSIIPADYRWDKVKAPADGLSIVNEVGTRDLWPVMARVMSWGYGPSGTFGFKTARVRDRYFDYGHSDFFTDQHVETYWRPFVEDGTVVASPWDAARPSQSWLAGFLSGVPFVKLVVGVAALAGLAALYLLLTLIWRVVGYL